MGRGSKEMDETWGNFPSCPNNINGEKNLRRECNHFFFFFCFSGYEKDVCKCGHRPNLLKPIFDVG